MSQYDFNIDNYTRVDLEKFLQLSPSYNEYEIGDKCDKIRNKLINTMGQKTKTPKYSKMTQQITTFLDEARKILTNELQKTKMVPMGDDRLIIDKHVGREAFTHHIQPVATYQTDVAQGNLNTLKKRKINYSLCMNTLFTNAFNSKDGTFLFVLPYPLKNVISMKLVSLEFPDTAYMISNQNKTNRIYIKEDTTELEALVILPEGNYDSDSLPDALQQAINCAFENSGRFTVCMDQISGKITIKNNQYSFKIEFLNDQTNITLSRNIGWYMGFRQSSYSNQTTYTGEGVFNPIPLPYVYFILNDYNIASSTTIMGFFSNNYIEKNILAKIPIPVDSFQVLFDNNSDLISKKREYFGTIDISKFSVKLIDHYGELIDLHQMDFSFTLELEIAYDL